jgi:cyclopropane fatty-acyl-phospholipid synthase-like methyltransferase
VEASAVPEFADRQLKEQQELYDAGWQSELDRGKEQRGNLQANLAFVAQTALLKPGDRILEIGCGIGTVVYELAKQGYDVRGTDISQVAVEYGGQIWRHPAGGSRGRAGVRGRVV